MGLCSHFVMKFLISGALGCIQLAGLHQYSIVVGILVIIIAIAHHHHCHQVAESQRKVLSCHHPCCHCPEWVGKGVSEWCSGVQM